MESYDDIEFTFNSIASVLELESHFKQMCDIYSDAKNCFDYAYALEYPTKGKHEKVINDYEPLQMLKYSTSRLALIELMKLYKSTDFYSFIKLINKLKNKHYGQFNDKNVSIDALESKIKCLILKNVKTMGLRDMIFAHQDSRSKIKNTKLFEVGYADVKEMFDETLKIFHQLHLILKIAPYHKTVEASLLKTQLIDLFESLLPEKSI